MDPAKKSTLFKRLLFGGFTIGSIVGIAYLDAFVIPPWPSLVVMGMLGLLAHWEIYRMPFQSKPDGSLLVYFWIGLAILSMFSAMSFFFHAWGAAFWPPLCFYPIWLIAGLSQIWHFPLQNQNSLSVGRSYLMGPHLLAIPYLFSIRLDAELGELGGLLFLIAIAKIGDIAAYFVGSFLGKRKFAPLISPNKTWEGAIASGIAAVSLAVFLQSRGWAGGLRIEQALVVALIVNVTAQIGDLHKSVLKRTCGVKDSGSYFSVMGGALDMIDSLIFAAPAYVALRLLWT